MIAGGVGLVHSNSLHVANQQAECADAYEMLRNGLRCLVQHALPSLPILTMIVSCIGSTRSNPTRKYQNPFQAVHEAWVLSWNVLCDSLCDSQVNHLQNVTSEPEHSDQACSYSTVIKCMDHTKQDPIERNCVKCTHQPCW